MAQCNDCIKMTSSACRLVSHKAGFHCSGSCSVYFSPENEGRITTLCPCSTKTGIDIVFTDRYPQVTMEQVDQLWKLYKLQKKINLTDVGTEGEEWEC